MERVTIHPHVGLKFRFSNEKEEVVICEITKIANHKVYFKDEKGKTYIGDFKKVF